MVLRRMPASINSRRPFLGELPNFLNQIPASWLKYW